MIQYYDFMLTVQLLPCSLETTEAKAAQASTSRNIITYRLLIRDIDRAAAAAAASSSVTIITAL